MLLRAREHIPKPGVSTPTSDHVDPQSLSPGWEGRWATSWPPPAPGPGPMLLMGAGDQPETRGCCFKRAPLLKEKVGMKTCKSSVSLSRDVAPTSEVLPVLKRNQWLRAGDKGVPPSRVQGGVSEARSHSLSQETSFCSEPQPLFLESDASLGCCEFQDPGHRSRSVCSSEHTGF